MSYKGIMLTIIPTLYAGYIVSVHSEWFAHRKSSCWPGSIQGSHRPMTFMRKNRTRANDLPWKLWNWVSTATWRIVYLVHNHHTMNETQNKHAQRTFLMYHAARKVEFQPFIPSWLQLLFFKSLYNIYPSEMHPRPSVKKREFGVRIAAQTSGKIAKSNVKNSSDRRIH